MEADGHHSIEYVTDIFIDEAAVIADEGYEEEEAPTIDELNYYALMAGDLFLGYFIDGNLVAFICGIRIHGNDLNMNSSVHLPVGDAVLVRAVCTEKSFKRLGIASCLLRAFLEHCADCPGPTTSRVLVHSPAKLIPLFTRSGFSMRYRAWYKQGRMPYYELEHYFNSDRRIACAVKRIRWKEMSTVREYYR